MNSRTWTVRFSGKLQILMMYYVVVIIIYLIFILRVSRREEMDFKTIVTIPLFMFPISIPVVLLPVFWLRKKKIPRSITLNNEQKELILEYGRNKTTTLEPDDVAYMLQDEGSYCVVVFKRSLPPPGDIQFTRNIPVLSVRGGRFHGTGRC